MLSSKIIPMEVSEDIAAKIRFMADSGVFALQRGTVTLNFDVGQIKSIKTEIYTYPQKTVNEVDIKLVSSIV